MTQIAVIRWPAFYASDVQTHEADIISPAAYHGSLPWYGTVTGTNSVTCAATQATMDAELEQAWRCGIDVFYYLFLCDATSYPFGGGATQLNEAIKLHLASPKAGLVKFGLIIGNANASTGGWSNACDKIVTLMGSPYYHKVNGHPVAMIFDTAGFASSPTSAGITTLQSKASIAGLSSVYVGSCNSTAADDAGSGVMAGINFLTRYTYALGAGSSQVSQASYLSTMQGIWTTQVANGPGYGVVISVSLGWDIRARVLNGYWCGIVPPYSCSANDNTADITPAEVATHVQAALTAHAASPLICNLGFILFGHFDEYTEDGNGLAPTYGNNGLRLQAIASQLNKQRDNPKALRARGHTIVSR